MIPLSGDYNSNIFSILLLLPGAMATFVIHESVKAACSTRLGDPTPKRYGFRSWNPFKYIEPIGLFLMLMFGFGWGQPVPTTPMYYKDRKKGVMITYITPMAANLLAGVLAVVLVCFAETLYITVLRDTASVGFLIIDIARAIFLNFAYCSISIAFFNLIPVYPLDGSKLLMLFLSPGTSVKMTQYEKILQIVLLLLLWFGFIGSILNPLTNAVINTLFRFF